MPDWNYTVYWLYVTISGSVKFKMPADQMPVGRGTDHGPEHWTQWRASLNVWSAQCPSHRQRKHKSEHKGHWIEIKISFPPGIELSRRRVGRLSTTPRRRNVTSLSQTIEFKVTLTRERRSNWKVERNSGLTLSKAEINLSLSFVVCMPELHIRIDI